MIDNDRLRQSDQDRETEVSGTTLVAFYGSSKPSNLRALVDHIQETLSRETSDYPGLVRPYRGWAHATLCGMEGALEANGDILTANMRARAENAGEALRPLAIGRFLDFVRAFPWPVQFQFGGYQPDDTNPYDANKGPWGRSFSLRSSGLFVLMGWPVYANGNPFAPTLYEFRQALHPFGVVHKYHRTPAGVDNDLFMVVAALDYARWQGLGIKEQGDICESLEIFQQELRARLQNMRTLVELTLEHIWLVKYRRKTLEEVEFSKQIGEVTEEEMHGLYRADALV